MNKVVDFLALLFHIRTANNTEGDRCSRFGWCRALLPLLKGSLLLVVVGFISLLFISLLTDSYFKEKNTTRKLNQLAAVILKPHKPQTQLPANLEEVVANSPLLRDLTVDSWGKPILYQLAPTGNKTFSLISSGKDQQLHTEDDLVQVVQINGAHR